MTKQTISIGINGSMLDDEPTGVGVYSFNLINNLSLIFNVAPVSRITVFTPTLLQLNKNLKTVKLSNLLQSSRYGKTAAFFRFIWNTFYYPFQGRGFDLLISPTTHGSFLLPNQIITIHDLLSLRYGNISRHQRFYFRYLLPFMVKKARFVIAVSETTKKDIIEFLGCPAEKITVIPNGYDPTRYYSIDEYQGLIHNHYGVRDYILAIGPTYPHKNFAALLLAYQDLDENHKRAHPLLIAGGKTKYVAELKELVAQLHLENYVRFTGYVPIELMPSLYREALALVFPSLHEGFGIPLLEAMACGCPVAASGISSMPEVCGDAAHYFDPHDKFSIAGALEKLIQEKCYRDQLRQKGIKRAAAFSWKQTAESFKKLIEKNFL